MLGKRSEKLVCSCPISLGNMVVVVSLHSVTLHSLKMHQNNSSAKVCFTGETALVKVLTHSITAHTLQRSKLYSNIITLTQHRALVLCHKTEKIKCNIYMGLKSLLKTNYECEHTTTMILQLSQARLGKFSKIPAQ